MGERRAGRGGRRAIVPLGVSRPCALYWFVTGGGNASGDRLGADRLGSCAACTPGLYHDSRGATACLEGAEPASLPPAVHSLPPLNGSAQPLTPERLVPCSPTSKEALWQRV